MTIEPLNKEQLVVAVRRVLARDPLMKSHDLGIAVAGHAMSRAWVAVRLKEAGYTLSELRREAIEGKDLHIEMMQSLASEYLQRKLLGADHNAKQDKTFIEDMLGALDGPAQREVFPNAKK